jgi:ketosteroid isomerase-like protein
MKRVYYIRTGILIIALTATMTVYSQQSSSSYQVQIEQLNRQMTDNMIRGDFAKNLDLYTSDAISLPSYEPMKEGLEAIRKGTEDMLSSGMKITTFETKTSKLIPGGDLITEIGTYKMTVIPPGSSLPIEDHGKYLNIWEKQSDGSLKIKVETWNSDLNPMQQTQPGQPLPQPPGVPEP